MSVITVTINGIEYNLKGDEQEEYLHKIASYVDKTVKNILENNNKLSTSSAAILSAVNIADDMFKMKEINSNLIKESEEFKKSRKLYEDQVVSLKDQIKHLEKYNLELEKKLQDYDNGKKSKENGERVKKLEEEINIAKQAAEDYMKENTKIKMENKDYRFQVQTFKYKLMDLRNKLEKNQIDLAKERKKSNPLLKSKLGK